MKLGRVLDAAAEAEVKLPGLEARDDATPPGRTVLTRRICWPSGSLHFWTHWISSARLAGGPKEACRMEDIFTRRLGRAFWKDTLRLLGASVAVLLHSCQDCRGAVADHSAGWKAAVSLCCSEAQRIPSSFSALRRGWLPVDPEDHGSKVLSSLPQDGKISFCCH